MSVCETEAHAPYVMNIPCSLLTGSSWQTLMMGTRTMTEGIDMYSRQVH